CVAAVYPLPNRIGTNWVRGADGQYTDAGKANHTKGSFSWAILYYNGDLPEMDWEPSPVDDSYPHAHTYDTQKAMWDEERSGAREISAYWRDTQLPFDCRTYQERLKKGIPLTEYQQRVVDAGGWPYGNIGITGTNTDAEDAGASGEAADASATGGEWEGSVRTHGASGPDSSTAYQEPPPASPPTNPLAGINIEPLLAHCLKHRDKWKESENPAHHTRWNHVINLIELGGRDFNAARAYAKTHASKGWKPWRELADMLGRV
ncbi:MAG: hypothetical protein OXC91_00890, partial [Rhodobacteraceae bacterium]|nr:hypothetical protein [Paracoccaceae bacterium]